MGLRLHLGTVGRYLGSGALCVTADRPSRQARQVDPQLGADLESEITALTKRRTFGLVFERNQPEAVELPGRPVRRGDKVRVLLPRGSADRADQRLWRVVKIAPNGTGRLADLEELDQDEPETKAVSIDRSRRGR
jgi:adenine-specific DNA-methyltransferase